MSELHHPFHVQVLEVDRLVFVHYLSGQLMEKVLTLVLHVLVKLGDPDTSLVSVIRSFDLSRELPLQPGQFLQGLAEVSGCLNLAPVEKGAKVSDT